jgi:hypothetical protein
MSREQLFRFLELDQAPVRPLSPAISAPSATQKESVSVELDAHGFATLDQDPMNVDNIGPLDEVRENIRPREFINFCNGEHFHSNTRTKGVYQGFLKGILTTRQIQENPMIVEMLRPRMPRENTKCWWMIRSRSLVPTLIGPETSPMQRPL